jgi:peptidoglycan/xylan/chitin deacetylase (PgdA/CDA1 family)
VVLTFDDGYADNFEQALPILEEFQVPATIFVSTGWVDTTDEAWWDELERIFLLGLGHSSGRPRRELEGAYWASHREIKGLPVSERRRRLDDLRRIWDVPPGGRASHRALSWEQVRRLARSPLITLGAHTVHHPQLSTQDRATQEQEIGESRRALESLTNQSIRVFSYPYGTRTDYDRNSLELVRAAGFEKVAANFNGPWFPGDSQWEIPRQLVRNWDRRTFLSKMKNFQFV